MSWITFLKPFKVEIWNEQSKVKADCKHRRKNTKTVYYEQSKISK